MISSLVKICNNGNAKLPDWTETLGGHEESPENLHHAVAGPPHVVDLVVDIMASITVYITVGIMVGIAANTAAGIMSQTCKPSPAKATGTDLDQKEMY
ncbi:hypothetical protein AAES_94819 [Amazona aestiva]|uniref:Uncharacterized protein n=1 Tax=Amazona aestiva TaxID=12930 RepID=A0A0Q3MDP0_AMAAE|nr:hypothetical protein AAES_94819 [Amazona aestiva]